MSDLTPERECAYCRREFESHDDRQLHELQPCEPVLRVGDKVLWRGGWGLDAPREVSVQHIETHQVGGYGYPVDELPWSDVPGCVVDLDNGKWAYGDQLTRIAP